AAALLRIRLVQVDTDRKVEGVEPLPEQIVVELLDARLVGDGWVRERTGSRRLERILAGLPVHEGELLRLGVVRLAIVVRGAPLGGDAAVVADFAEVALAQAEEDGTVDLGVAADEVLRVWPERRAVLVVPELLRDVALLLEDLAGVPVLGLPR